MPTGAITEYIDVAQLTLYAFWIFFAGLIYYLHRENKREGYPLESDRSGGRIKVQGFPAVPSPKTFLRQDGSKVLAPSGKVSTQALNARPSGNFLGAPLDPTGTGLPIGVGPGSYADREDKPDLTFEGEAAIVPLRRLKAFSVARKGEDPRGFPVVGADGVVAGTVSELWVDRGEMLFRYLEVSTPKAARGPQVLLPINFARITGGKVLVKSLLGAQIADVPRTKNPDQVTKLEEEKIMAYYGSGVLYAVPSRKEPLL